MPLLALFKFGLAPKFLKKKMGTVKREKWGLKGSATRCVMSMKP